MIILDGSYGEGGGQIIRTALALSTLTGKAFEVNNIRKGRCQGGLKNQHLHGIKALTRLCNAKVEGAFLGSESLKYEPGKVTAAGINADIGTAGSTTLILQSLLIPCMFRDRPTKITITGGTDTKWSQPFDYLANVLIPHLRKYAGIELSLLKRGYYPKGGGKITINIKPFYTPETISKAPITTMTGQGSLLMVKGISHASSDLEKASVAERQADSAKSLLRSLDCPVDITAEYCSTSSCGSGITLWALFSSDSEVDPVNPVILGADSLGTRGKPAEKVGKEAAESLIGEIRSKAPVDRHLADQLLPFMALTPGSRINVSGITGHCKTNIHVIEHFLPVNFKITGNTIEVMQARQA